jgi:hypothetical protein
VQDHGNSQNIGLRTMQVKRHKAMLRRFQGIGSLCPRDVSLLMSDAISFIAPKLDPFQSGRVSRLVCVARLPALMYLSCFRPFSPRFIARVCPKPHHANRHF